MSLIYIGESAGSRPRHHVVPLDRDEDVDELSPKRVEELARFVSGIGGRSARAREGIDDAVRTADARGFDLEHVDDIQYGIRSNIWRNEAIPLNRFVEILGKQASVNGIEASGKRAGRRANDLEMGHHRLDVRTEKRGGLVVAAAVHGHMLIGLDGAERIEQLADQHGEARGRRHE